MIQLVDTLEVRPEHVDDYLDLVRGVGMAVMTEAGATFVSCATTSGVIGEPVQVQVVWAFDDHVHWNEIRRNLVLDPRWYEYGAQGARLRLGGTRRFYTPNSLVPR
jgi:hypothetical protein